MLCQHLIWTKRNLFNALLDFPQVRLSDLGYLIAISAVRRYTYLNPDGDRKHSRVFTLGCRIIRSTLVGGAVNKLPDNATPGMSGWRVRHSSFFVIFRDFPFCVLPLRRNRLTFFLDSTCF